MMIRQKMLVVATILFVSVQASALLLIYSKHQSRKLFAQLQQLNHEVGALNTQWSQLQLEQSAWSGRGRIERKARTELSMVLPEPNKIIFVELK